ncbi:MAG: hypothetical protein HY042_03300 [Spirochaetia bacterium]|nr:hypothetical protein [Spirochaetia bacterium]
MTMPYTPGNRPFIISGGKTAPIGFIKQHFLEGRRRRLLFVAVGLGVAVLSYALVLGDAGWAVRRAMEHELADLEQETSALRQENDALQDQYTAMESGHQKRKVHTQVDPVIIKFEDAPRNEKAPSLISSRSPALGEMRAVYVLVWAVILTVGFFLLPGDAKPN